MRFAVLAGLALVALSPLAPPSTARPLRALASGSGMPAAGAGGDCNSNGVPDAEDISGGTSQDCNANAIPDECDIAAGTSLDCNANGTPDECEPDCNANDVPDDCDLTAGTSADCNANAVPDECDIAAGTSLDCNANGIPDSCDVGGGASLDCNANGTPDECELDCNANDVPDDCDLTAGTSEDCNANEVPDECDLAAGTSLDCNSDGTPDECEPDCNANEVPDDCDLTAGTSQDCNANAVPDECDIAAGTSLDCNANGIPDSCDVGGGASLDCNANGTPDECELDCNANDVPDDCDLTAGTSEDCNANEVPDECDLAAGTSLDCNSDGTPDECEPDCNANEVPDDCDLTAGTSQDCNANAVPDECDIAAGTSLDCNANGIPDSCDVGGGASLDCNANGTPDECELDCNANGVPDDCDLTAGTSEDCNENEVPDECDLASGTSTDGNGNDVPDECETLTNVVVFFLDDVGPDQLALFDGLNPYEGSSDPFVTPLYADTPNLDALAANGVTFTNAYSAPLCSPARASLLTGMYPARTGVGSIIRNENVGDLAEFGDPGFQHQTLAELAHTVGYTAGTIGKWHLALPNLAMDPGAGDDNWLGWDHIPQRGHWDDYRCTFRNLNQTPYPANAQSPGFYNFFWNVNGDIEARTGDYATTVQLEAALDFCNGAVEPFVCVVSPNASHSPWGDPPPASLVNTSYYLQSPLTIFKGFCAMLEALDTEIGNFMGALDPDVRARTLVLVMGDNGTDSPVLRSARDDDGFDLGNTYDFLLDATVDQGRFKHSTYERGLRVPLIASGPMIAQPGRSSDALVDVVDLYATIAEVIGADAGDIDGISFKQALGNSSIDITNHARQFTSAETFIENGEVEDAHELRHAGFSLRISDGRRFKLHRVHDFTEASVSDELYQLQDVNGEPVDPFEEFPLPIAPGQAYFDEYMEVAQTMAPPIQSNYCISETNSSGQAATIQVLGSASISNNDMILVAEVCPANQPGIFYYGPAEIQIPFGNGFRCVGSGGIGTFRLPPTAASPSGTLQRPFDHGNVSPNGVITPGSTWKFQAWFRDPVAGGAFFDLSDGLSIRFAP